MYSVANRVFIKDPWVGEFEERFQKRARQIEGQPGFIRMMILRPDKGNTPHVILTIWQSKAAFESWLISDDFRLAHRNPMPEEAFYAPSVIEYHEVSVVAQVQQEDIPE